MAREKSPRGQRANHPGKADPDQSRRFVELAREMGCEENFDRLDQALKGARVKPGPMPPPEPEKEELPE